MTSVATAQPGLAPAAPLAERELVDGRYRLLRRIGRGASAQVWSAEDERLQRRVALKLFAADVIDRDRERVELEVMVRLTHPGLVSVFDAGSCTDRAGGRRTYLVLELVAGGTLRDRLACGELPAGRAACVGSDIARTLGYMHACGVVHRDVKPSNILLTGADVQVAKLGDFGVARMLDAAHLTDPGMTVGTANYISPEQLRGQPAGPPSDVYALGLVLLEALTGQMAYPGSGMLTVEHLDRAPLIPTSIGRDWHGLLTAMTDHDLGNRPTASDVAASLDERAYS